MQEARIGGAKEGGIRWEKNAVVEEELREFFFKIAQFEEGNYPNEEFKPRRLWQGVYGQRQPGFQMVRIKIPGGRINKDQILVLKEMAEKYSKGTLHITTRQDIQFHFVRLKNVPKILEKIAEVGLTTREACGNTIRNITASIYSGLLRGGVMDVVPVAHRVAQFFLRREDVNKLPRKFKISFSENERDYAWGGMHDIGVIAKKRGEEYGFKIVVGGGLGSQPFPAKVYKEFVPAQDLLRHLHAILRVFDKYGERKKRMKARIKFLIQKLGWERFVEEVEKEYQALEELKYPEIPVVIPQEEDWEEENPFSKEEEKELYLWYEKNISPTIYKDEFLLRILVPIGDLYPYQVEELIKLYEKFLSPRSKFYWILTEDQNLVLPRLYLPPEKRKKALEEIYSTLQELSLHGISPHSFEDPVACPGTSSCSLGITHSKGLGGYLRKYLQGKYAHDPRFEGATLHISGCPNSCGRHHVATLGFFGRSEKLPNGEQAPAYNVMIGGGNLGDGKIVLGKSCGKILARRIPQFIDALVKYYEENSQDGESFVDFCYRVSKEEIKALVQKFSKEEMPLKEEEEKLVVYDWGKEGVKYEVKIGEGECAV